MTEPSRITRTRSDSPSTSGTSLRHQQHADPVVGQRADQRVDLRPGPDVDAAGRLVEQQQPASRRAASGRGRPSAGCRRTACGASRDGSSGRTCSDSTAFGDLLRARGDGSPSRTGRTAAASPARRCAATDSPSRSAWLLRSSGARPRPRRTAVVDSPGGQRPARRGSPCPPVRRRAPYTVSRTSERPAPTSPAMPTISPARDVNDTSRNVLARARFSTRAARRRSAGSRRPRREGVLDRAAGHQRDDVRRRRRGGGQVGGDGAAVLEHGDPVADRADLLEPVRDVDDGDALRR